MHVLKKTTPRGGLLAQCVVNPRLKNLITHKDSRIMSITTEAQGHRECSRRRSEYECLRSSLTPV